MTTVEKNLANAQAALHHAEQNIERQKKAEVDLVQVRADGRRLSAELEQTQTVAREADAALYVAENEIKQRNYAINQHLATKPAQFPSGKDFEAWDRKLRVLTELRDESLARKRTADKVSGESKLHALHLGAALVTLRNREAQLAGLARGEVPEDDWPAKGGISVVA